ncbi:MAG TPA: SGNH/GDSL hydrolase family protein [Bryobacteraceae bacterium]|nr:SGNH/GDSL hydrolase family protein [Bryobacteraceae bacterium]
MRSIALLSVLTFVLCFAQESKPEPAVDWHDVRKFGVEGQGWKDTKHPFDRLPAKAEGVVRPPVWDLSQDSAGLCVRFSTDASIIRARWTLRHENLALPHMPATGVSGLDLYVRLSSGWHWIANGRPLKQTNEQTLVGNWPGGKREYMLYFPLYNGAESVEIGVPPGVAIEPGPPYRPGVKPILFYGTSILQGGCAARPGMAYPSIIGRMFDWPTINQGYSGNGKSEPEIATLFAEIDPAVYVYDSLPNLNPAEAKERVEPFLRTLRKAHPRTPIVLVENVIYTNIQFSEQRRTEVTEKNATLKAVYQKLRKQGDKNLYYVPAAGLFGSDGEATVDGVHPTDLGFLRMAQTIAPVLKPLLRKR